MKTDSKMALWPSKKPESKTVFTGTIQLSPEIIAAIQQAPPNEDGVVLLRLRGFKNDSDNPKAPKFWGFASIGTDDDEDDGELF
jgi:hypothetical protein